MLLYVALNYVFLSVAPADAMRGQVEVGYVAARSAFGETGGRFAGLILAALLISTVSSMTLAGPRVLQVVGEDFHALHFFARIHPGLCRFHARAEQLRHRVQRVRPALAATATATTLPDIRISTDAAAVPGTHWLDAGIRAHQQTGGGPVRAGRHCLRPGLLPGVGACQSQVLTDVH